MASVDQPETSKPTEASQELPKREGGSLDKQEDKGESKSEAGNAAGVISTAAKEPPASTEGDQEESSDESESSEDEFPSAPGFIPRGKLTGPVGGGGKVISKPRPTRP
ncbi:hypothetical protein BKA70DRAFT_1213982 [Coprinopsis sp. MPI-PUGE-AT-0042]|nr:hypothetical protein BKA70DRAFT_1213982 [Coprinopsis sp. MPI-PUGE-AT-0042]